MELWQRFCHGTLTASGRFIFGRVMGWQVTGRENVPPDEAVIVAINHVHRLDSLVVLCAVPTTVVPLVAADVIRGHPRLSAMITGVARSMGGIVVDRHGGSNLDCIRAACQALNSGVSILIAPEGTRNKRGGLLEFQEGAAYLALATGASIVPVVTQGYGDALKPRLWGRAPIRVTIGERFQVARSVHRDKSVRRAATEEIRGKFGAMLGEVPEKVGADGSLH
jgi:1-acyl-sn-glycerol-3-phosphate acyltransferase